MGTIGAHADLYGNAPGGKAIEGVGESALKRMGRKKWRQKVQQMLEGFRSAFLPDYIALGGGNARLLKKLPAKTHVGTNTDAFRGGFRLWSQ